MMVRTDGPLVLDLRLPLTSQLGDRCVELVKVRRGSSEAPVHLSLDCVEPSDDASKTLAREGLARETGELAHISVEPVLGLDKSRQRPSELGLVVDETLHSARQVHDLLRESTELLQLELAANCRTELLVVPQRVQESPALHVVHQSHGTSFRVWPYSRATSAVAADRRLAGGATKAFP